MSPASVTTNSGGGGAGAMPKITIMKRSRADVPFAQRKFLKKTKRGKVMKGELMGLFNPYQDADQCRLSTSREIPPL